MKKTDAHKVLGKLRFAKVGYLSENAYLNMKKHSVKDYVRYRKHNSDEHVLEERLIVYFDFDSSKAFEVITGQSLPVIDPEPENDKVRSEEVTAFYICDIKRGVSLADLENYLKREESISNAVKKALEEAINQKEKSLKEVNTSLEDFIDKIIEIASAKTYLNSKD